MSQSGRQDLGLQVNSLVFLIPLMEKISLIFHIVIKGFIDLFTMLGICVAEVTKIATKWWMHFLNESMKKRLFWFA